MFKFQVLFREVLQPSLFSMDVVISPIISGINIIPLVNEYILGFLKTSKTLCMVAFGVAKRLYCSFTSVNGVAFAFNGT